MQKRKVNQAVVVPNFEFWKSLHCTFVQNLSACQCISIVVYIKYPSPRYHITKSLYVIIQSFPICLSISVLLCFKLQVLFIGLVLLTSETPGSRDGTIAGKGRNRYPGSCLNPMLLRRQPWSLVDFLLTYGWFSSSKGRWKFTDE